MTDRTIRASAFKARCLALLDDVAESRTSMVITRHGKAVARVVPIDEGRPTLGSVTLFADGEELYFSTGERWDADARP